MSLFCTQNQLLELLRPVQTPFAKPPEAQFGEVLDGPWTGSVPLTYAIDLTVGLIETAFLQLAGLSFVPIEGTACSL